MINLNYTPQDFRNPNDWETTTFDFAGSRVTQATFKLSDKAENLDVLTLRTFQKDDDITVTLDAVINQEVYHLTFDAILHNPDVREIMRTLDLQPWELPRELYDGARKNNTVFDSLLDNTRNNAKAENEVVIYSKADCPACNLTKNQFAKANIPFTVVDLATLDDAQIEQFREQGLMQAPIVEFQGERTAGFRPDRIRDIAATLARPNPSQIAQVQPAPTQTTPRADAPAHTQTRTR